MTEYEVTLTWRDGRGETLQVADDETILDAAEAVQISLPFGCRRGTCATCTGKLHDGAVSYDRPPRALKDRHRADGYVLTCIATPDTDCAIEVGSDVQSDLVSNPWK